MTTRIYLALSGLSLLIFSALAQAEGSIRNHLTLDLMPIAGSPNNPAGAAFGLYYDRYHEELKSNYSLGVEFSTPYASDNRKNDLIVSGAFFTEITKPFSLGARIGVVTNNSPNPITIGALALRLPAIHPQDKEFFSFFYEEIDLGIAGAGERYACIRLGMLLL